MMVSEQDIKQTIQQMVVRPQMWAQTPASLEDQVYLLLGFLDLKYQNEFRYFCRKSGCGNGTLTRNYTTFVAMQRKLKEFIDTKVDVELLARVNLPEDSTTQND